MNTVLWKLGAAIIGTTLLLTFLQQESPIGRSSPIVKDKSDLVINPELVKSGLSLNGITVGLKREEVQNSLQEGFVLTQKDDFSFIHRNIADPILKLWFNDAGFLQRVESERNTTIYLGDVPLLSLQESEEALKSLPAVTVNPDSRSRSYIVATKNHDSKVLVTAVSEVLVAFKIE